MTYDEIVQMVATDLNITARDSIARIGRHVNLKYRELVAKPWLQISRRGTERAYTTIGVRYLTFNATKIYAIFNPNQGDQTLGEMTFDELRNGLVNSDPAQNYAIAKQNATSITVFLDCLPASVYALVGDVEQRIVTLSGDQQPKFNEDFHDILYYGAKYLELMKMEKPDLAMEADSKYMGRISDLKFHIAGSAYLQRFQGKDNQNSPAPINTIVQ